jgi:hypothetical protein
VENDSDAVVFGSGSQRIGAANKILGEDPGFDGFVVDSRERHAQIAAEPDDFTCRTSLFL